jgi:hypothetical protein
MFLFIFVMKCINYFYELYFAPTSDFFKNHPNQEHHKSRGRAVFNTTCGFYSIEKFPRPI